MSDELPKSIKNILTDDETIEEVFYLKDCEVYATNKRLIERRKRRIRDFDYSHVSNIQRNVRSRNPMVRLVRKGALKIAPFGMKDKPFRKATPCASARKLELHKGSGFAIFG